MKNLRYILSYLKYYKKEMLIAISLVIVETFFELIIPFFMKDIIDIGIKNNDLNQIYLSGALIVGCAILSLITGNAYAKYNAKAITGFSYRLREEAFTKIQEFSFSNIDDFNTNSLITRVTNDVTVMQNTLAGGIRPLCRAPMMLTMGIALAFMLAPQVAWIFLCFIPILGIILFFIVRNVAPKYKVIQKNIDSLNQVVRENVTAIRTVKSYVREDYEFEKFSTANEAVMTQTKLTYRIAQLNQPSFQLVMYTVTTLILFLGSRLVHNESLEVGSLSALLSYILQIINSLMMISNIFLLINRSFASADRLVEIFETKSTLINNDKPVFEIIDSSIEFKNVCFKYKNGSGLDVLSAINLKINAGESIGIIGSTGASKSTLVSLIPRLYDVTSGEILVGNKNVKNYDLKTLRDNIAIVLQNNVLFSGTVRENLLWGNKDASDKEVLEACSLACADEFLERLPNGLDYDLGQGGVNVSGGQKQRLCIARALLKKPKIIIFDDSTSACDMETERKIMKHINSLTGVTKIVIGQRISSVMNLDRIIVLADGKIDMIGNHDYLLENNAYYRELYKTQIGGNNNGSDSK